ncbi:hypothetical protein A1O3_01966 [Capronia epimyces CBS 606.96]|uniref:Uncharacterized protein n=1 Tax=Capronia epimyces CBS 606.96 TaxID=1182542 RepID=W9Y7U9_9EURO|nr:uncharacterized protein A1O3_01966 [Capronia epimyces CBS 606.96]EXJ88902.1 hypothetical protein A1O3_01966 [Capronia epimyces CBS 606.96]
MSLLYSQDNWREEAEDSETAEMQASPSKARAAALEAHSWSLVLSWLSDLYQPWPVPSVERNAATLKALQGLMAENVAADQVRALVSAAQREEVAAHSHDPDRTNSPLGTTTQSTNAEARLRALKSSLPPASRPALDSLAGAAVLLGYPPPPPSTDSSSFARGLHFEILGLARQMCEYETQLSSIDALIADLDRQIAQVQHTISAFPRTTAANVLDPSSTLYTGPAVPSVSASSSPPSPAMTTTTTDEDSLTLHAQTLQHQRETKQLALKCAEYRDRIGALERRAAARTGTGSRGTTAAELAAKLAAKQDAIRRKTAKIDLLEAKVRSFHGLPPDLHASRAEVHRAQAELDRLGRKRDALFERMGA